MSPYCASLNRRGSRNKFATLVEAFDAVIDKPKMGHQPPQKKIAEAIKAIDA